METLVGGLTIPWDVVRDPNGVVVTGERGTGRVLAIHPDGTTTVVAADFGDLFTCGESGLMGVALAPDFARAARSTPATRRTSPMARPVTAASPPGARRTTGRRSRIPT